VHLAEARLGQDPGNGQRLAKVGRAVIDAGEEVGVAVNPVMSDE